MSLQGLQDHRNWFINCVCYFSYFNYFCIPNLGSELLYLQIHTLYGLPETNGYNDQSVLNVMSMVNVFGIWLFS